MVPTIPPSYPDADVSPLVLLVGIAVVAMQLLMLCQLLALDNENNVYLNTQALPKKQ